MGGISGRPVKYSRVVGYAVRGRVGWPVAVAGRLLVDGVKVKVGNTYLPGRFVRRWLGFASFAKECSLLILGLS